MHRLATVPRARKRSVPGMSLGALLCLGLLHPLAQPVAAQSTPPRVGFNQDFVQGLETRVNVDDTLAVFALVFRNLADKAVVYPTENYYYWRFTANGRIYWGNFRLDANDRDDGVLHLGYFEYDENGRFQDYDGWGRKITAKDGVVVKKVSHFAYLVTYKGRTVTFQLNDAGFGPPKVGKLRADEVYIGPVFDESGIKFHLIFNTADNFFLYMVDEDDGPRETYRAHAKDKSVLVGRRTGFAYYDDRPNGRKILIAVNGWNARRNNYYDGPFDQLPDNYVDRTKIADYIVRAYPHLKGRINKFGHVKGENGARVAINAYAIYNDEAQLDFVASCRTTYPGAPGPKFYACIAPDMERQPPPKDGGRGPSDGPKETPGSKSGTQPAPGK